MAIDNTVLAFFRRELSLMTTLTMKPIPIEMDTPLQGYAAADELGDAIEKYDELFGVDVSDLDMVHYYPWKLEWFFRKWFTEEPIKQVSKPLTVRMFAESAKAGKWLFD
ncbi:cytoplasmic protein [Enterobacterales bacterium CwR94]|nr:cytoplasmic protein [Enterobacterales bacterium CwR94]